MRKTGLVPNIVI
jgi:hypothetical protein